MSPANTFRFFAVFTTIALTVVCSPVPGLVDRNGETSSRDLSEDLEYQGSITVEVKTDPKRPNDINNIKSNNAKDNTNSISGSPQGLKDNTNKISYQPSAAIEKIVAKGIDIKNEKKQVKIPVELSTETILVTKVFNVTLISQQTDNKNKLQSSDTAVETTEETKSIKQDLSQINDTPHRNQTEITTTDEVKPQPEVTLLDTIQESTTNSQTVIKENIPSATLTETDDITSETSVDPSTSNTTPTWKKYTTIDRKRVTTTAASDDPITSTDISTDIPEYLISTISEQLNTTQNKSEVMVKLESAQTRFSLQDAITSDIPSLEKLKSDLLSFPKIITTQEIDATTLLPTTEESITETDFTTLIINTDPSTLNTELLNTVSSMRAGYLDLSIKNSTNKEDLSLKPNGTELLQGPFDAEAQEESSDDKAEGRVKPQSQLDEDTIKEELLKEEMFNDNAEISKRLRGEGEKFATNNINITELDEAVVQLPHTAPDDSLSVKPINSDKIKNTVLYPVNPNYKPLKKIEVQPAKPFVRDPDDNSWRNESLSSLGIVFKPKNSSKPFTQVLKNKTETEWNNLSEKDRKNEVPDLRVRLEQIAQKRKSKKKKIDSLGNVYYTDYEESSSSEENPTTPQAEDRSFSTVFTTDAPTMAITIVTPIQNTSLSTSNPSVPEAIEVPALTTIAAPIESIVSQTTPKTEPTKPHKPKSRKMFNLFDYYETNDDEDITDYLNMAKIDLKRYTVPIHTTYTPYTPPPLPIVYTNPMTHYTEERKGTVQYFPPRTTKRPRINKQNNVRDKINIDAVPDSPKDVLPISYHKLTTPYDGSMYYTNSPDLTRAKDYASKNFDRNLYLTTPPLTTLPDEDFGVIGNEGIYNRPSYVIKHYKEYMNGAAQQDVNKQSGPFTEPPLPEAITEYIKPITVKDKTTVTEDYDYDAQFRKDLLDRFVANFNEKSNRFKSDFPIVYNNSIVHGVSYDDKDAAMSRTYFRRPYSNQDYKPIIPDPYDPNCENVTVELSPAYELHYYVPEQEEKQEVEPKPINLPNGYRL